VLDMLHQLEDTNHVVNVGIHYMIDGKEHMTVPGIYSPRPKMFEDPNASGAAPSAISRNLVGEAVGIVDNGKLLNLGAMIEEELLRLGALEVKRFRAPRYTDLASTEFLDDIAAQVAGAVTGLGN
jgi:hypothetical protein